MPRQRLVSDDQLLDAAERIAQRDGPVGMTLEEVGSAVGVTAAAVLRRFGSKRALLLAVAERGAARVPTWFTEARARHDSPIQALLAALSAGAAARTREELATGLAFLALDVRDDAFRAHARAFFDAFATEVRALLDAAVEARELRATDTEALGRAVEVAFSGSTIRWGIRGDSGAEDAMMHDVGAVLEPYLNRPLLEFLGEIRAEAGSTALRGRVRGP